MMDIDGIMNLVEAICVRAAKDYRRAKGCDLDARLFFESQWFGILTCGADGTKFLERLDKEIRNKKKRVRRRIHVDAA